MKALLTGLRVFLLCFALTIVAATTRAQTPEGLPSPIESSTRQEKTSFKTAGFQAPAGAGIIYLPLVVRQVPGISGRVTYQGVPALGVDVALRFYNGASWSTAATTSTDSGGFYVFANPPSLLAGQVYYVRFGPNTTNCQSPFGWCGDKYLSNWHGPLITSYAAGSAKAGGSFDIANVVLLSPDSGGTVLLPAEFTWQRRQLGNESYRWVLYDRSLGAVWRTSDLGDVDNFALPALPQGFGPGAVYEWYVEVYTDPDSYGTSYFSRFVTFSPAAAAKPGSELLPQTATGGGERSGPIPVPEGPRQ